MKCIKCGKEYGSGLNYCPHCGNPTDGENSNNNSINNHKTEGDNVKSDIDSKTTITINVPVVKTDILKTKINLFSEAHILSIIGLVLGALFIVMLLLTLTTYDSFNASNIKNYDALLGSMGTFLKIVPILFYVALFLIICLFTLSIINNVRYKDIRIVLFSIIISITFLIMLLNMKFMHVLHVLINTDASTIFSKNISASFIADMYKLAENPDSVTHKFMIMLICGIAIFVYSIYLFIVFKNKTQIKCNKISLKELSEPLPLAGAKLSKSYDNTDNTCNSDILDSKVSNEVTCDEKSIETIILGKKTSKKQKFIAFAILALMIASIGGYILWDNFLNVTKLDLTSNIKLTYSGRSGEASISNIDNKIKYNKSDAQIADFVKSVRYDYSNSSKLKNGDKVTVTAVYDKAKAKELKLKILNPSKKIKVTNLPHRFSSADKVSSEIVEIAKEYGTSKLKDNYISDEYNTYNFNYYGTYFLQSKKEDMVVAVFKLTNKEKGFDDSITISTNYYYYALKDVDSGSNKKTLKEDEFFLNYGLLDIDGTYITTEPEIVPALSSWYGETVSKVTKLK